MSVAPTRVAAAVILRADGQVLLAQRPAGKAYAGYWEFPGGKLEAGETPHDALVRELHEELGLAVRRAAPWFVQRYVYPHANVELHFFRVYAWDGEPVGHDGQAFRWQVPGVYDVSPLLPANTRVLAALELPQTYGITCAEDLGEAEFLRRAERSFECGLKLAVVREKTWPLSRRDAFARNLLPLANEHGVTLLLNGSADDAIRLGLCGVHWTADALAAARERPTGLLTGASCHARVELEHAADLGLDFAALGPIRATPTHPGAMPIGFAGFRSLAAEARLPVFALGGLRADDVNEAVASGAHGVALRRGAWPA